MNRVPLTVFHLVQHGVEAEFIPSFQEFLQPEGGFLLFTETAFLPKPFISRYPLPKAVRMVSVSVA